MDNERRENTKTTYFHAFELMAVFHNGMVNCDTHTAVKSLMHGLLKYLLSKL